MQGVVDTNASWFEYIGLTLGYLFDWALLVLLGWFGAVLVFLKALVKQLIEEMWDKSLDLTTVALYELLDKLGFEDISLDDIRSWVNMANYVVPVKESLAWIEAYFAFRIAKFTFKSLAWLNPLKG